MGDITQIPTLTIPTLPASTNVGLGPVLVDPSPTHDHTKEVSAEALNYLKQLVIYLQQITGPSVSGETLPPTLTLRDRMGEAEEQTGLDRFVLREHFDRWVGGVTDPSKWDSVAHTDHVAAVATQVADLRAGALLPKRGADFSLLHYMGGYCFKYDQLPWFRVRLVYDASANNATDSYFGFLAHDPGGAAGGDGAYVSLRHKAGNVEIVGIKAKPGVANVETVLSAAWTPTTEVSITVAIIGGHAWASVDDGTAVDLGEFSTNPVGLFLANDSTTGDCTVRNLVCSADWS